MRRGPQRACALLLLAAAWAAGCARPGLEAVRASAAAGSGHLIDAVPFVPQERYQCGPAALAMVLRYWGAAADAEAIGEALYLPALRGTLNVELEFHARRRGFATRAFAATLDEARAELRRGHPLIVFQDLGPPALAGLGGRWSVPHFAVLLGYDDRAGTVVLHSGLTAFRVVPVAEFERGWSAGRRWTLLVTPPPSR